MRRCPLGVGEEAFFPKVKGCALGVSCPPTLQQAGKSLPKVFWGLSDVGLLTGLVGTGLCVHELLLLV